MLAIPGEDHTSNKVLGRHLLESVLIRRVKLIPAEEEEEEREREEKWQGKKL